MSATPNPAFPLAEPPDEVLERIVDAFCELCGHTGSSDGVTFLAIHQHNAVNHTLSGTVDVDGVTYGFIVDNGDWNGTVVRRWGDPEDVSTYQHVESEPLTFVPINPTVLAVKIWRLWQIDHAPFLKLCSDYAYDRHFAPGHATETHYRAKAAKRGLEPGYASHVKALPEPGLTAEEMQAAWAALPPT